MKSVICIDNNMRKDLIIGKRYEILEVHNTAGILWYRIKDLTAPTCVADRFAECKVLNNNIRVI